MPSSPRQKGSSSSVLLPNAQPTVGASPFSQSDLQSANDGPSKGLTILSSGGSSGSQQSRVGGDRNHDNCMVMTASAASSTTRTFGGNPSNTNTATTLVHPASTPMMWHHSLKK